MDTSNKNDLIKFRKPTRFTKADDSRTTLVDIQIKCGKIP